MGEYADEALNSIVDPWFDDPWFDDESPFFAPRPLFKSCSICNTSNLHWQRVNGRWRLFTNSGREHICPMTSGCVDLAILERKCTST